MCGQGVIYPGEWIEGVVPSPLAEDGRYAALLSDVQPAPSAARDLSRKVPHSPRNRGEFSPRARSKPVSPLWRPCVAAGPPASSTAFRVARLCQLAIGARVVGQSAANAAPAWATSAVDSRCQMFCIRLMANERQAEPATVTQCVPNGRRGVRSRRTLQSSFASDNLRTSLGRVCFDVGCDGGFRLAAQIRRADEGISLRIPHAYRSFLRPFKALAARHLGSARYGRSSRICLCCASADPKLTQINCYLESLCELAVVYLRRAGRDRWMRSVGTELDPPNLSGRC